MIHLRFILVVCCVVLAGCATPVADEPNPDHEVSVTVMNNHDRSYDVSILAVPPEAKEIELGDGDGSTQGVDGPVEEIPRETLRNATSISFDGDEAYRRELTLAPNRGLGTTIPDVPPNSSVVYFVQSTNESSGTDGPSAVDESSDADEPSRADGPSRIGGPGIVQCGSTAERTDLRVTILADGSLDSRLSCQGADGSD